MTGTPDRSPTSPIMHLIVDATVGRGRLDRQTTSISLLVVISVREDGQTVLLTVNNMGGETSEVRRTILKDLVGRSLRRPEFLIPDGPIERRLAWAVPRQLR